MLETEYDDDEGGCSGRVLVAQSKSVKGTLTIFSDSLYKITGYLDLKIKNNYGSNLTLKGPFEIPAIKLSEKAAYLEGKKEKTGRAGEVRIFSFIFPVSPAYHFQQRYPAHSPCKNTIPLGALYLFRF
jgi:hypothetical protein